MFRVIDRLACKWLDLRTDRGESPATKAARLESRLTNGETILRREIKRLRDEMLELSSRNQASNEQSISIYNIALEAFGFEKPQWEDL